MDQSTENTTPAEHPTNGTEDAALDATLNASEIRIKELEAQAKEKEQKYLYLYADFENYKKRAVKERADLLKFGWENAARDLLEVVDNLERALNHMPKPESKEAEASHKTLEQGLRMVLGQFKAALDKQGVQRISTETRDFDPNLHEAVAHETSEHPEGKIAREESSGYTLHGRLLRPARVVISRGDKTA